MISDYLVPLIDHSWKAALLSPISTGRPFSALTPSLVSCRSPLLVSSNVHLKPGPFLFAQQPESTHALSLSKRLGEYQSSVAGCKRWTVFTARHSNNFTAMFSQNLFHLRMLEQRIFNRFLLKQVQNVIEIKSSFYSLITLSGATSESWLLARLSARAHTPMLQW